MADAIEHKDAWLANGGETSVDRVCKAAVLIGIKYGAQIDSEFHTQRARAALVAEAVKSVRSMKLCRSVTTMSLFGSPSPVVGFAASLATDSVPTGDFIDYMNDLSAAVYATNGSVSEVTSAANAVLSSASGLSYADYQIVASGVDLAISSAETWNAQDWGPSGDFCEEGTGPCIEEPYSLFMRRGWLRKTLVTVGVDVVGCAGGAASSWYAAAGGPVGWGYLAGQCGIWAATGSAGAVLAFFAT